MRRAARTELSLFSIQGFARYYPNPKQGLHFGVSMGGLGLELSRVGGGQLSGPSFSIEAGDGVWLARQWSFGIAARLTAAELHGDLPGTTALLMPGVFATIACH